MQITHLNSVEEPFTNK